MGPELMAVLPQLLAAGVGTAMSVAAQKEAASDRRKILNRQLDQDAQATDKSVQLVQDEGQRYGQEQRLAGLQDQEKQAFDQAQADIQGAGGTEIATAAPAGAMSSDFLQSKAARAIEEGTRMTSIAREAAKGRAPGMLQFGDSLSQARLTGDLHSVGRARANMAGAAGLDAENVEAPWYGGLGRIATAVGGAMASQGAGAQQAGTPPNPYVTRAGINWGAR